LLALGVVTKYLKEVEGVLCQIAATECLDCIFNAEFDLGVGLCHEVTL